MGKSKKNSNFDSRGMHRSEDDLGYLDQDASDDMMITPDSADIASQQATTNTATMQAKKLQQEQQTSLQDKRANQPDR
jgi:hypothetical protein